MLTRLKVTGFKNLVDVDMRFGPFTCIAGANGVGKSNLFDAIAFLSALADRPLQDSALSVRDEEGRTTDLRSIFHHSGDTFDSRIAFEAEMIVPLDGFDDLGQPAHASITFLRYALELAYRGGDGTRSPGTLELLKEDLSHIKLGEAKEHLPFPHTRAWRDSAIKGRRTSPLISTNESGHGRVIMLHQDGVAGRPLSRAAASLPRTVLSSTNAAESPTAVMARREMQSWRLLQLEPLALRRPDQFSAPTRLGVDGSHLPATLYHLAQGHHAVAQSGPLDEDAVYARVANRLAELIDDVDRVWVDRDDRRELLTLMVSDREGTEYPARALSDGTMRFLALAVLELDPTTQDLLCLEEPENGIHPAHIPSVLRLLRDIDLGQLRERPTRLTERIQKSIQLYPCELPFVHRDAERQPLDTRLDEIERATEAARSSSIIPPVVSVVPVRMQEAWLLFDEAAIRRASGNPNGHVNLQLPSVGTCETLPDPKEILHAALRDASELSGRRRQRFDPHLAALRLADLIDDFAPLRALPAFQRLESDLGQMIAKHSW